MHGSIVRLVESYGYGVVFLFVAIESLGVPLPGETVLVTAGALAALGHLSIWWVIAIAALGGITGDAAGYWIGRLGGVALIKRYGRVLHFDDAKLERVRAFFSRHGAKTVFLGRFIALLRTWAALLAGTAEMPYGVFTLYNVMGGITWAALFGTLASYAPLLLGDDVSSIERGDQIRLMRQYLGASAEREPEPVEASAPSAGDASTRSVPTSRKASSGPADPITA